MPFDPNPLFFEMAQIFKDNYSDENKVIICNEGGSRCFAKNTNVLTKDGYKPIQDVKPGEKVLTYNEKTKKREYKTVKESLQFKNTKKTYKVNLSDGTTFTATEDHEFYYKGGWHSLKHLLSLHDDKRNMDKD